MATTAEIDALRALLGEVIPPNGTEDDTLFSRHQLEVILTEVEGDQERAAYEGWRIKAAHFANLVDVTDGASTRSMGDLHKQALDMVKLYSRASAGATEGRARVGRIVRT